MGCGSITRSEVLNCAAPLVGGIATATGNQNRLILWNWDEVSFTESASTPNLYTALTMASGMSGYQFQGYKISLHPSLDLVAGANGQTLVKDRIAFVVFSNSQLTKNTIQNLMAGRYIAAYENNGKNSDSWEIMGVGVGLEVKPQKIRDLQENGAAYMLLLETPEAEMEVKLPNTFFITSYAATTTALLTTLFLPTVTNISDLALQSAGGDAETITGTNFWGSIGLASEVVSVQWVNQTTGALTTQTGVTVVSNVSMTFTSVAQAAGTYKLRVTTTKGVADSTQIAICT